MNTCEGVKCTAQLPVDAGRRVPCENPAVTTIGDRPLCGTHSRQYNRWLGMSEGTARVRARHFWGWE